MAPNPISSSSQVSQGHGNPNPKPLLAQPLKSCEADGMLLLAALLRSAMALSLGGWGLGVHRVQGLGFDTP